MKSKFSLIVLVLSSFLLSPESTAQTVDIGEPVAGEILAGTSPQTAATSTNSPVFTTMPPMPPTNILNSGQEFPATSTNSDPAPVASNAAAIANIGALLAGLALKHNQTASSVTSSSVTTLPPPSLTTTMTIPSSDITLSSTTTSTEAMTSTISSTSSSTISSTPTSLFQSSTLANSSSSASSPSSTFSRTTTQMESSSTSKVLVTSTAVEILTHNTVVTASSDTVVMITNQPDQLTMPFGAGSMLNGTDVSSSSGKGGVIAAAVIGSILIVFAAAYVINRKCRSKPEEGFCARVKSDSWDYERQDYPSEVSNNYDHGRSPARSMFEEKTEYMEEIAAQEPVIYQPPLPRVNYQQQQNHYQREQTIQNYASNAPQMAFQEQPRPLNTGSDVPLSLQPMQISLHQTPSFDVYDGMTSYDYNSSLRRASTTTSFYAKPSQHAMQQQPYHP